MLDHTGLAAYHHDRDTQDPRQWVINHQQLAAKILGRGHKAYIGENAAGETAEDPPVGEEQEMIHCAASQGITSSVKALLVDGRVHPDFQDRFGRTALHWAAGQGHLETVVALLSSGALIHLFSLCNATPLMLAALGGHDNVVRCLLRAGAGTLGGGCQNPCLVIWKPSALHYAAKGGHIGVVTTLLNAGFHRDQPDEVGLIPAEISARASHASSPAVTRLLLGSGQGGPLLHKYVDMAMTEDVEIVRGLVQAGAFLDWQDPQYGRTPLHRAVYFRHFQILKILLEADANPNLADCYGVTPLHLVAVSGCTAEAARLLEAGADTTARTRDGYSPLHLAVAFNRVAVARLLLGAPGSSIELRDDDVGITPLSWASRIGYTPMLSALLEAGADLESRSAGGLTPLHWACRSNAAESVDSLLGAGADPEALDDTGADAGSVIGLGDPVGCTAPQSSPFRSVVALNEGVRRLNSAAADRIRVALEIAKKDRAWSRRGWLVILAGRRAMAAASKRLGLSASSSLPTTCSVGKPTGVDGGGDGVVDRHLVEAPGDEQRDKVTGGPYHGWTGYCNDVRWPSAVHETESLSDGPMSLPHESRRDIVGGLSQASGSVCASGSASSGFAGCVEDGVGSTLGSGTVEALLDLAAMEKGVFRHVVRFI